MTLTPISDFQNNYEVKDGQIATALVLNKAIDKSHQELISLWNFVTGDNLNIDDTKNLIDDTVASSNTQTRSISGLHAETFNGGTWS